MLNFYKLHKDYLLFKGSDRLDLINRLSTNLVTQNGNYSTVKTVLTSDKGRIIDLLEMFDLDELVLVSCSFNNSQNVISHLDKYTIMDDFTAENLSGTHYSVLFTGDSVTDFLTETTGADLISVTADKFTVTKEQDAIICLNDDKMGGYIFIYSADDKDYWDSRIFNSELISKYSLNEISQDEFKHRRISLGIPAFGKELSELTNPLECGLGKYVSFTKGCYIGQEVIARLDAYDKISKHMVQLNIEGIADDDQQYKITTGSKECGFITSTANSTEGKTIALGFIKTIFLNKENNYNIIYGNEVLNAEITEIY